VSLGAVCGGYTGNGNGRTNCSGGRRRLMAAGRTQPHLKPE